MTEVVTADKTSGADARNACLIRSGADLVELVEQLYRRLFDVTLRLIVGGAALSTLFAGLRSADWHDGLTAALAIGCTAAALLTLRSSPAAYSWLRQRAWRPGIPAALGSFLLLVDGPAGPLWFVALACIAATSVLASRRQTMSLALLASGSYILGTLLPGASLITQHDPGRIAAAAGLTLDGLLCVAVVEWLARFVLRLHKLELEAIARVQPPLYVGNVGATKQSEPTTRQSPPRGVSRLTARQLEVVVLLRDGLRQDEIAECLSISARQVERLVADARARVDAHTTAGLVALLVSGGLVPPPPLA
jgi:DNA-binding CsgD family transcriptional regulator